MTRSTTRFNSAIGSILTFAGIAIGLGNVWRFPYMMGSNGGSTFLITYVVFMLLLAVPAIMAEWSLGRATRCGPVEAYRQALGRKAGLIIGLIIIVTLAVADSYYMVMIAKIAYTGWFSTINGFNGSNITEYQSGLSSGWMTLSIAMAILLLGVVVLARGLRRGIEAISTLFVPLFGVIALIMIVHVLSLDGALEKISEFIRVDPSNFSSKLAFDAMGQACFSIGLGGAVSVMYGSYLKRKQGLVKTAIATGVIDTGAAFLASLFIIPAVLVFGIDLAAGPTLIFQTLPQLFASMPAGHLLGSLFLISLVLVAALTAIAALEAIIAGMSDLLGQRLSRKQLIVLVIVIELALMIPTSFHPDLIGVLDIFFGNGMFMVGSLMAVIAMSWGLGYRMTLNQIGGDSPTTLDRCLTLWLKYVVPLSLIVILVGYVLEKLEGAH